MSDLNVEEAERVLIEVWEAAADQYDGCRTTTFTPRATELIQRAGFPSGSRVLDVGTGTGIAAFEALQTVGPTGYVLGVDTSPALVSAAQEKAREGGYDNLEFRQMPMSDLDLDPGSFDHVIGNYSLCCTLLYEQALRETHRVLGPGGTLTYNHEGPHETPVSAAYKEVLATHRVSSPSPTLQTIREAQTLLEDRWVALRDPFVGLRSLREAGFHDETAFIAFERLAYPSVEAYLDYRLSGSLEARAMGADGERRLREELLQVLEPFASPEGLVLQPGVLTFRGVK